MHANTLFQGLHTLDKAGGSRPGGTETGDFREQVFPISPSSQVTLSHTTGDYRLNDPVPLIFNVAGHQELWQPERVGWKL